MSPDLKTKSIRGLSPAYFTFKALKQEKRGAKERYKELKFPSLEGNPLGCEQISDHRRDLSSTKIKRARGANRRHRDLCDTKRRSELNIRTHLLNGLQRNQKAQWIEAKYVVR